MQYKNIKNTYINNDSTKKNIIKIDIVTGTKYYYFKVLSKYTLKRHQLYHALKHFSGDKYPITSV